MADAVERVAQDGGLGISTKTVSAWATSLVSDDVSARNGEADAQLARSALDHTVKGVATAYAPTIVAPKGVVFPRAVDPKYSTLSAGKARMKTCLDQYHANKANNALGGLKWIQKGGGYYSLCNARLKNG